MASDFTTALITFLTSFTSWQAYLVILGVLLACGLGVPIPEDITLLAAGILAAIGTISFTGAMIAGLVGVLIGDTILFFLGRKLGRRALTLPGFRRVFTEKRIQLAEEKIRGNSRFVCFTARFLPGLRAPVYFTAGMLGVKPIIFLALDGFAALISVPVWVYLGWYFGNNLEVAVAYAKQAQIYVIIGVVIFIAGYILFKKYVVNRKPAVSGPK